MPKVSIATIESAPRISAADCDGEELQGAVHTLGLLVGPRHALHLRLHQMGPGARIAWPESQAGFLAYVWSGSFDIGRHRLASGSVAVIEHHAAVSAVAVDEGSALLVFNGTEPVTERRGGRVHLLPVEKVPRTDQLVAHRRGVGGALFADAGCSSCELWLHETTFYHPNEEVALHSHSEDEVIVITGGEIVLGNRTYRPGSAIAIAAGTIYGFRTGARGSTFINFRPRRPTITPAAASESIDEQLIFRSRLGELPCTFATPVQLSEESGSVED